MRVVLGGVDIEKDEAYESQSRRPSCTRLTTRLPSLSTMTLVRLRCSSALHTVHPLILFQLFGDYLHFLFFPCAFPRSPAPASSHRQAILCKGDSLCEDGLSDQSAVQQRHRVRDLRVGRHGNT